MALEFKNGMLVVIKRRYAQSVFPQRNVENAAERAFLIATYTPESFRFSGYYIADPTKTMRVYGVSDVAVLDTKRYLKEVSEKALPEFFLRLHSALTEVMHEWTIEDFNGHQMAVMDLLKASTYIVEYVKGKSPNVV